MPQTHRDKTFEAIKTFTPQCLELLKSTLTDPAFRGKIEAATVKQLMAAEGKNGDEFMLSLLPVARTFSRPPLSNFLVGAVLHGISGNLYLGANIEVAGQPLGLAVHAEQASVANAYAHGESGVTSIAVTAAPCGHCRQFLNELSPTPNLRVLRKDAPPTPLSALLPMAFGPKDLGLTEGALPVRETDLTLTNATNDEQITLALKSARQAYAPYTKSPSGVAIRTADGRLFGGSYIENAAFNPSLPPLQAALAGVFASGQDASAIQRVVLVEVVHAAISQRSGTQTTLSALAPQASLDTFAAQPK
jgi:cytidine deaminase